MSYSQPDFYKFNSDSVELAKYAASEFKHSKNIKVLDLCCGCGVVGLEFYKDHHNISRLDFLENQKEFKSHIERNSTSLECSSEILLENYHQFITSEKYDLILCNPPYFKSGHGRVSPNMQRQKCRTFKDGDIEGLVSFLSSSLAQNGVAFIVHREDLSIIDSRFELCSKVSGADLFRFILNVDRS